MREFNNNYDWRFFVGLFLVIYFICVNESREPSTKKEASSKNIISKRDTIVQKIMR